MIEVQLMKKFLQQQKTSFLDIPSEAKNLFELLNSKESESIKEACSDPYSILNLQSLANSDLYNSTCHDYSFDPTQAHIKLLSPVREGVLNFSQFERIKHVYNFLYPDTTFVHYSRFYEYSNSCVMEGEVFTTYDRAPHDNSCLAS